MTRKIIVLIIVLGVFGIGLFFVNKNIYPIWNANRISVSAELPLKKEKVKVYYGASVNTINRNDDTDLFNNMQKYILLYDGKNSNVMPNEYGENDFLITYDDNYYFSFRQFKIHSRAQHTYKFKLTESDGIPIIQVDVKGCDSMKFERPMILIADAEKYRCNVLKEKAGNVYNMIELVE